MTQDQAFDILTLGQNVFLTGAAGTGKTFLVNRFITYCHEHGLSVAVTASTGIAATHIGGMTIHSWSGIGVRDTLSDDDIDTLLEREYLVKRFQKIQILIIDEISMLSGDFLDSLHRILKQAKKSDFPFGGMQMVFVGDFFQLPPVASEDFAFSHEVWKGARIVPCILSEQYRQTSDELSYILGDIRSGHLSGHSLSLLASRNIPVTTEDHTELFTKNIAVDAYNNERLHLIHSDTFLFEMHTKGAPGLVESLKKGCLAPEMLSLKIGARVMFVKNNFEAGYANGSLGHIVGRYESLPIVELLDGTKVIADYASWAIEENGKIKAEIAQVPLRLAWAITVHKSQGMTLDSAVMDLSDCFTLGQGYVALSRVRTLGGLILRGYNETALQVDTRVIAYYEALQVASKKSEERILSMGQEEKREKQHMTIRRFGGSIEKMEILDFHEKKTKVLTHIQTYDLLTLGKTLHQISEIRGIKYSTILSHIEKCRDEGKISDVSLFFHDTDREALKIIQGAFIFLSTTSLSVVREYLHDLHDILYDYDDIRLARLLLDDAERRKIEANMIYESEGIE